MTEVFFKDRKDLLGSDHYQLMSAKTIIRFWTVVSCLAYFLDEQRASLQAEHPGEHFSLGDARQSIRAEHKRNLLVWLEMQFQSGATAVQVYAEMVA